MNKIIDVTGKQSVNCPKCGFTIAISPRTISMEKLGHMNDVKKVSELLKKTEVDSEAASNPIILICPLCNYTIVCRDKFSNV